MDYPNLSGVSELGLDYETTGVQYWKEDFRVLGFGIAVEGQQWYFDLREHPGCTNWLRDTLPGKLIIAHSAQFEYQVNRILGMDPRSMQYYCTMIAECLIDEHMLTYNLEDVASYNGVRSGKRDLLDQMQAAMGAKNHDDVLARLVQAPPELVAKYGGNDARMAYEIRQKQRKPIIDQELERVLALEMELLPVLCDMSATGVRVDLQAAHDAIPALDAQEVELTGLIKDLTGCKEPSVFVNSPKQMREFFKPEPLNKYQWRTIDGTLVGPTKGGKKGGPPQPSLGQDALRQMRHPVAAHILGLRKTIKLRDTFIRGHIIANADHASYVHTTFNQTRTDQDAGTVTGRLSSTDPALQQITKRDKRNAEILRAMFLPDEGDDWLCADYSQVDFRCAADLMNDPELTAAYWADPTLDFHQIVSDMTGIPRNAAYAGAPYTKQINLGMAFGAGSGKLAMMMGMPYEIGEWKNRMVYYPGPEARRVFDQYHKRLPYVKKFMDYAESVAKSRGFVKTRIGRRLRRPGHKAAGLLYQAYAADLHKVGLIESDRHLRESKQGRLIISVHDEIGASMDKYAADAPLVQAYTNFNSDTSRIRMKVPILASHSRGPNWWEASK